MLSRIHINGHVLRRNKRTGEREHPITVKTSKSNTYTSEARIIDPVSGRAVARVVYRPQNPLSCGATVWVETECNVEVGEGSNEEEV